jgi:hypothetical protein
MREGRGGVGKDGLGLHPVLPRANQLFHAFFHQTPDLATNNWEFCRRSLNRHLCDLSTGRFSSYPDEMTDGTGLDRLLMALACRPGFRTCLWTGDPPTRTGLRTDLLATRGRRIVRLEWSWLLLRMVAIRWGDMTS